MNRFLEKIAGSVLETLNSNEPILTRDELLEAVRKRGVNAELIFLDGDQEGETGRIRDLLPEDQKHRAEAIMATSIRRGPGVFPTQTPYRPSKSIILSGLSQHTTPMIHEVGHAIDYDSGNPTLDDLKVRLGAVSSKLSRDNLVRAASLAASVTPGPVGIASAVSPLIISLPRIRNEVAANIEAAKLVREEKGRDESIRYLKEMTPAFNTYLAKPLALTGAGVALHLGAKRVIPLIKRATLEKHGEPERKPRSEMTPAELKVLKYKSIAARQRRAKELSQSKVQVKPKVKNKYLEKIAYTYSDASPNSYLDPVSLALVDGADPHPTRQAARYSYLANVDRDDLIDASEVPGQAGRAAVTVGALGAGLGALAARKNRLLGAIGGGLAGAALGGVAGAAAANASTTQRYDEIRDRAIRALAIEEALRAKAREAKSELQ